MDGRTLAQRPTRMYWGMVGWQSFMAFITSLSAAGVAGDWIGLKGATLFLAIVAALHAATAVVVAAMKAVETARTASVDSG